MSELSFEYAQKLKEAGFPQAPQKAEDTREIVSVPSIAGLIFAIEEIDENAAIEALADKYLELRKAPEWLEGMPEPTRGSRRALDGS